MLPRPENFDIPPTTANSHSQILRPPLPNQPLTNMNGASSYQPNPYPNGPSPSYQPNPYPNGQPSSYQTNPYPNGQPSSYQPNPYPNGPPPSFPTGTQPPPSAVYPSQPHYSNPAGPPSMPGNRLNGPNPYPGQPPSSGPVQQPIAQTRIDPDMIPNVVRKVFLFF
jgi:hypothetical protein